MSESKTYCRKDYKSDLRPVWCAGCGDFGAMTAAFAALAELSVPPHDIALISGIGCSSRLPGYAATYGLNTIHGRAIPVATGLKAARPDLTVIAVAGDGDAFSIGGGHFPHVARRNSDLTYIVLDNSIYGLTKGQTSPTTPLGETTSTSAYGWPEDPMRPLNLALACGVSFVAQGASGDVKGLTRIFVEAIRWPGFAFVEVLSPCVTWRGRKQYDAIRERSRPIPPDHDVTDRTAAFAYADDPDHLYMGVYYRKERPTFEDRLRSIAERATQKRAGGFSSYLDQFRS